MRPTPVPRVRRTAVNGLLITVVAMVLSLAMACSGGGSSGTLQLEGVGPLQGGFEYQGWAVVDGETLSIGRFNISSTGNLVDESGNEIPDGRFSVDDDLAESTSFFVTVEPPGSDDDIPSGTVLVGGDLSDGGAALAVGHGSAIGNSFENASGFYILATPTDGPLFTYENSGIWWRVGGTGGLERDPQGLFLPVLPDGWIYEGWVVLEGVPLSTGKFIEPREIDFAAPYSGPVDLSDEAAIRQVMLADYGSITVEGENGPELVTGETGYALHLDDPSLPIFWHGPPEPGEDFMREAPDGMTFPTDIRGAETYITVEPIPDDSPEEFAFRALTEVIPADARAHTTFSMDSTLDAQPRGTVRID